MNPLVEDDALQEAQLIDMCFDALDMTVGLLFDLRGASQLRESNTGLLIARGVRELAWSGPDRGTELTAWTVGSSRPWVGAGSVGVRLSMWPAPGAELTVAARSAVFVTGDVPDLLDAPPDLGEDDLPRDPLRIRELGIPGRVTPDRSNGGLRLSTRRSAIATSRCDVRLMVVTKVDYLATNSASLRTQRGSA
jgi:hypothetical protein